MTPAPQPLQASNRPQPWSRPILPCAALAILFTLLNSLKPLHIDDAAFYSYAAQAARSPLSPYGFELVWKGRPRPANEILAPPLLPYWWAVALHLFGDRPFLWKLWLLPFALVLVFSLRALLRRFARGLEGRLLLLIVLSPWLLPAFNLMLDVPALSLSLCALALFLRAADRGSARTALLAGAIAGLAMQTKYTAVVTPPLLLLYGTLFRRLRLGILAAGVALLLFAGWEVFVAVRHGQSHLLCNLAQPGEPLLDRVGPLFRAMLNVAGGLAPATALLGLAALGFSGQVVFIAGAAALTGYVLTACVPGQDGGTGMEVSGPVCRLLGLLLLATLTAVARRLLRRGPAARLTPGTPGSLASFALTAPPRRTEWFLVLWLAMEVGAYFVLTPFPAARRVIGMVLVATLLVGRLAARTCRRRECSGRVAAVTAAGVLLGLSFYAVDLREAVAERRATELAVRRVSTAANAATWYAGTWGFHFYAARAGFKEVVLDSSRLRAGDWLVVPESPRAQQWLGTDGAPLRLVGRVTVTDGVPLRTVCCYYGGTVPLVHCCGPRVALNVYRVSADFVPTTGAAQLGLGPPHASSRMPTSTSYPAWAPTATPKPRQ